MIALSVIFNLHPKTIRYCWLHPKIWHQPPPLTNTLLLGMMYVTSQKLRAIAGSLFGQDQILYYPAPELSMQPSTSPCEYNMAHYRGQGALPSYINKLKFVEPGKLLQQNGGRLTHTCRPDLIILSSVSPSAMLHLSKLVIGLAGFYSTKLRKSSDDSKSETSGL